MRYFVESYGCTMNYGEGDIIASKMRALGHSPVDSAEDADIVILNTCTVVDTTEKKMIERISQLKSAKKEIIVTGCMAKAQTSRISVRLPGSLIIPPESYDSLSDAVAERYPSIDASENEVYGKGANNDSRVSAIIPIAQGCLGNCSYCIVKFARGDLVSYPVSQIKEQFTEALERGCKEIQITAQDTACYGSDTEGSLPQLMRELLSVPGEYKIRIGMMNPESLERILEPLMDIMRDDRVYRFIHVPVQSGSDELLKKMNRRYTASQFIEMIEKMRSFHSDISISTDIITGFPGERDDDHKKSLDLIRTVSPDTVNVTRFSARPGTAAAAMDDHIHGRVSKERSRGITAMRFDEAKQRNDGLVGKAVRVLVTEAGKNGTVIARTDNYRPVIIPDDNELGMFLDVVITGCEPTHLFGRPKTE
ncbi:MAG: tRNA (N(6)-L-threonylcarbamoyladenosine(37)-C(2))-methylthiotransferase [Methanomassiliicoccaceae archaeon]|nr:tRNA (N(6)-L-threonylcarbamoyladenosine(37)-C(2))-methylthiotransferase [Methanomassiliicoccaceae archaeon]